MHFYVDIYSVELKFSYVLHKDLMSGCWWPFAILMHVYIVVADSAWHHMKQSVQGYSLAV